MPVKRTQEDYSNYLKSHRKVFLGPSCILIRTVASHKPARINFGFAD